MICRVYDRAVQAKRVEKVIVATDDERILQAVEAHGGSAMMTAKDHPTGTDRLAEVAEAFPEDRNMYRMLKGLYIESILDVWRSNNPGIER